MYQRLRTAFFFVIATIVCIFIGKWGFTIYFSLILLFCLWEYYTLVAPKDVWKDRWRKYSGIVWGVIPFAWSMCMVHGMVWPSRQLALGLLIYLTALLAWFFVPELFVRRSQRFSQAALGLTGLIYIALPFGCLPLISFYQGEYVPLHLFGILLLVWANDSGAYLAGIRWGKSLLLPLISPRKTWEGWVGGTAVTIFVGWLLSKWIPLWTLQDGIAIATLVAIWGPMGDLVESMLKREFEVKDSGRILPGHGGVLDRFDAFVFTLPPIALYWLALR